MSRALGKVRQHGRNRAHGDDLAPSFDALPHVLGTANSCEAHHLKDHDGHAQQFQALVQEDIASVVLRDIAFAPNGGRNARHVRNDKGPKCLLTEALCRTAAGIHGQHRKAKDLQTCCQGQPIVICCICWSLELVVDKQADKGEATVQDLLLYHGMDIGGGGKDKLGGDHLR